MTFVVNAEDFRRTFQKKEWTVGAPKNGLELTEEELDDFKRSLRRMNRDGVRNSPVNLTTSEGVVDNFLIEFSLLRKILYEYERYSAAEGFSDAEMDVLRAIEFHEADRVGVDEIMEQEHTKEYSESTIYRYLRELREKGLIKRVRSGVYQYDGP